jgi:hypothetical protein
MLYYKQNTVSYISIFCSLILPCVLILTHDAFVTKGYTNVLSFIWYTMLAGMYYSWVYTFFNLYTNNIEEF